MHQSASNTDCLPCRSQRAVQVAAITQAGGLDREGVGQVGQVSVRGAVGQSTSEADCLLARGERLTVPPHVAQAPSQCCQGVSDLR